MDNEMNEDFYVRGWFVRKLVIAGTVMLDLLR
jgi:hypothetical protein